MSGADVNTNTPRRATAAATKFTKITMITKSFVAFVIFVSFVTGPWPVSRAALLQAAQPRPAVLQGRVVRLGTGTPVAHASVVAARVGGLQADYRTAVADETGRFAFRDVSSGTYRVYATREGYLQAEYGRRPAGTSGIPIVLGDGQTSPDIVISMTPTGAIAGRVTDRGRPARNVWVRALKARYFDGERSLSVVEWARTDDRGEYRLFDLAPGSYVVSAIPLERPSIEGDTVVMPVVATTANGNERARRSTATLETVPAAAFERGVHPAVYHPGTTDPSAAQPVEVRAGQTVPGVDFTIATASTYHVHGVVTVMGAGSPLPNLSVNIWPIGAGTVLPIPGVQAEAGSFDLPRVPPGRYFLSAQTLTPPGPLLRNVMQIEVVDRDLEGVAITLRPGVTLTGRLSIEGLEPVPAGIVASIQLRAAAGMSGYSAIRFQPDGTFTIDNVTPGEYRFRVLQGARPRWVKSARFGGEDVLTAPVRVDGELKGRLLEVVLSPDTATLDARVVDGNQRPVSGVLVIAVPDAARRNQSQAYRAATTDADGSARLDGLTPGEYTLFASESVEAADWQDPAVLQRYERRGTVVRFRESATETITLRVIQ
jgi:hypothetical protein